MSVGSVSSGASSFLELLDSHSCLELLLFLWLAFLQFDLVEGRSSLLLSLGSGSYQVDSHFAWFIRAPSAGKLASPRKCLRPALLRHLVEVTTCFLVRGNPWLDPHDEIVVADSAAVFK